MLSTNCRSLFRKRGRRPSFSIGIPTHSGRGIEVELAALGRETGLEIVGCKDVSIHERDEVLTSSGEPFRVFTPYARAWAKLAKASANRRVRNLKSAGSIFSLPLPTLETWGLKPEADVLEAGEKAARARMKTFLESGLATYGMGRNALAGTVTSRLSQDLRFGLLSIRELLQKCQEREADFPASGRKSAQKFISELIWREFYLSILWHFPEVLDMEFNLKFPRNDLAW